MTYANEINILKVRNDHKFIRFIKILDNYELQDGFEASWVKDGHFSHHDLRNRIEPWLTALFQSEHLSLLAGSGLTHAMHYLAADKPATGMDGLELNTYPAEINKAAEDSAVAAGREEGNLEDQLRVANELLRGLEIPQQEDEAACLSDELETGMLEFANSILKSEANIVTATGDKREHAFNILVTFLMSFASRTGVRDRLNIFTTNYDRLLDAGAEVAGLHLAKTKNMRS